ncbi:MAG: hypothetical protein H6858_08755 [Rhodospirillales bacterium]|nr:hypothetical protein [Alphaproteobacteria bacterium]MCB1839508.1 hypothetical protein [Alphaproteobacteria bacterium]MCB9977672.1 hypothetical protein [Rhodospirillales bacterium]
MASFDFLKAAIKGYQFAWFHGAELFKFSFPVVFIGVFCELVVIQSGMEENILRRGLLELPATFAQGYFLCELVRYVIYNEPFVLWGYARSSKIGEFQTLYTQRMADRPRKALIQGAVIFYVFQILVATMLWGLSRMAAEIPVDAGSVESVNGPDLLTGLVNLSVVVLILLAAFWSIRLSFLYISFAMGYGVRRYLRKLAGFSSSASLFLCSIFVFLFMLFPAEMVLKILTMALADFPAVWVVLATIVQQYVTVIFHTVMTISAAFGIKEMVEGPSSPRYPNSLI